MPSGCPSRHGLWATRRNSSRRLIDVLTTHAQSVGHALSPVERGAVPIGGEGQQNQYRSTLGAEARQPVLAKQAILKPAEAASGPAEEIGSGRGEGRLLPHRLYAPAAFLLSTACFTHGWCSHIPPCASRLGSILALRPSLLAPGGALTGLFGGAFLGFLGAIRITLDLDDLGAV
jgi:hypothetical protein